MSHLTFADLVACSAQLVGSTERGLCPSPQKVASTGTTEQVVFGQCKQHAHRKGNQIQYGGQSIDLVCPIYHPFVSMRLWFDARAVPTHTPSRPVSMCAVDSLSASTLSLLTWIAKMFYVLLAFLPQNKIPPKLLYGLMLSLSLFLFYSSFSF